MHLCPDSILVEELVKINCFVKEELPVVLYKALFLKVEINSAQLEHHYVWRPADPCFKNFPLARFVTLEAIDF